MARTFVLTWMFLVLCAPAPVQAGKVKYWQQHTPAQFEKAQIKQTVVSSEGSLRLSKQLKLLANLNATHVWDVVEDKDGNVFVATGNEGKLFKVTPEGKVSVVFDSEDSQILSLALAPDGTLYAGTGPSGLIVRIDPAGNGKVLFRSPELYIWSLALDAGGHNLYAGTGPKGRIYRVTSKGKAGVFHATKQEHILSLALSPEGMLYAGTDKKGLVYRIDAHGKGFVLYQAPQQEVRSLLIGPDGIYAGTSAPTRRRLGSGSLSGGGMSSSLAAVMANSNKTPVKTGADAGSPAAVVGPSTPRDRDLEKSIPAPSSSPPASGENSLYRIATDGTVREIFRDKVLMLTLLRQNGRIYIGTGMEGQLFEVDEATKERSEIARLDNGQIHRLYRRRDGSILLCTGDPGKLYVLQDGYAPKGTVTSDVLDAKIVSKWGALRWQADAPKSTKVSVAVRSGNLADPDDTWSDWSAEQTDSQQAMVMAPPARFLQYRVTLTTDEAKVTPAFHGITIRYMTTNQAPEVSTIEVPDLDGGNLDNPKKLRFRWTASDQNDDDLSYNLYVRKEGWKSWVQLEENLEKKDYEWDTTTTPSGLYQLKVVASDRKDNPDEEALTGERISTAFAVAHEPPSVRVRFTGMEGDQAVIEAVATDPMVRLTTAAFSLNGKKWTNVFPSDGLFDSKKETFKFKTETLKNGTYVLVLRVKDAAGNTGSGDVVFALPARAQTP